MELRRKFGAGPREPITGAARYGVGVTARMEFRERQGISRSAILIVIPIALYYALVFTYSVNVPFWDDFELLRARPTEGVSILQWLGRPNNEHRIVLTNLAAKVLGRIEGHLDFRHLSVIGNLLLVPCVALLFGVFSRMRAAPLLFVPVAALMFSAHSWENMIWPTASIQSYGVLVFAFSSLQQFFSGGPRGVGLSLVLAACGAFTSASGLLIFPVLALWAGTRVLDSHPGRERRSRFVALGTILFVAVAVGVLFRQGHTRPPHASMLAKVLEDPLAAAVRVPIVIGSFINVQRLVGSTPLANWIALVSGVTVLAFFVKLIRRGLIRRDPLLFHLACFLVLSACAIAAGRATHGYGQAMSSRYVIVSASMVSALYLAWLGMADLDAVIGRRVRRAGLMLAFTYLSLSTVESVPKLAERRDALTGGMQRWVETGTGLLHHDPEGVDPLLRSAMKNGYYRSPD